MDLVNITALAINWILIVSIIGEKIIKLANICAISTICLYDILFKMKLQLFIQ